MHEMDEETVIENGKVEKAKGGQTVSTIIRGRKNPAGSNRV